MLPNEVGDEFRVILHQFPETSPDLFAGTVMSTMAETAARLAIGAPPIPYMHDQRLVSAVGSALPSTGRRPGCGVFPQLLCSPNRGPMVVTDVLGFVHDLAPWPKGKPLRRHCIPDSQW